MAGGNRALWSLRMPLEHLVQECSQICVSLEQLTRHYSDGEIADAILAKRFEANLVAFMNLVEAAKNYPCIKKALGRIF